jgi:hypothetical protein
MKSQMEPVKVVVRSATQNVFAALKDRDLMSLCRQSQGRADEGSKTSPQEFLGFCSEIRVPFQRLSPDSIPIEVIGAGSPIVCPEVVYDCSLLRKMIRERLAWCHVPIRLGCEVTAISGNNGRFSVHVGDEERYAAFDAVINCVYAELDRLSKRLGHAAPRRKFEYTSVLVISLDVPAVGVTVMDGPFMTLLPYGFSNRFLLYHVERTVIAQVIDTQMPRSWCDTRMAPLTSMDRSSFATNYLHACQQFVPALERASVVDILQGPRMVLARNEDNDARPSIINQPERVYFTVFSGKIDHRIWVVDELVRKVQDL